MKVSPDGLAFLPAVKAADRAILLAGEQENDPMLRALEAARAPLAEHLVAMGLRLPDRKVRRTRGRSGGGHSPSTRRHRRARRRRWWTSGTRWTPSSAQHGALAAVGTRRLAWWGSELLE